MATYRKTSFCHKHEKAERIELAIALLKESGLIRIGTKATSRRPVDGLESPDIFNTPEVRKAGGKDGPIKALPELGQPANVLLDTKTRLFTA